MILYTAFLVPIAFFVEAIGADMTMSAASGRDFPCDFVPMRECDSLGDDRKCSSSANGCAESHCGNHTR